MYFPYFRGRQYDLLALKELVQMKLISSNVVPVIEPVKIIPTLKSTLKAFEDANLPVALILNPDVGDLKCQNIIPCLTSNVIPAILLNKIDDTVKSTISSEQFSNNLLTVLNNRDNIDTFNEVFLDVTPKYIMHPDERSLRRTAFNKKANTIIFEDRFNKQTKNSDYQNKSDEFFSDDHLYYQDERYFGFGDYSIIGEIYSEGGFAPYAVAIHIVYFDNDKTLRVHHFVSNSNDDTKNVAKKFYEALQKLIDWCKNEYNGKETHALKTFIDYANSGYYPGLPTIKKLSIMHHLEIVSDFLGEGE